MPSSSQTKKAPRPHSSSRKKVNRQAELHRVAKEALPSQRFAVHPTRKAVFPGQAVRLFGRSLEENYAGQQLKETNPSEYLRQLKKLQAKEKMNAAAAKAAADAAAKARLARIEEERARAAAAQAAFKKQWEAMMKEDTEQRQKRKEEDEAAEMSKLAALFSGSSPVVLYSGTSRVRGPGSRGSHGSNSKKAEALRKLWNEW